jgi:type II secretory pathway pseudopilin PulG
LARLRFSRGDAGFSLVETLVATGIMATALVGLAQMFAISVANNRSARTGSFANMLAQQKLEQLRGLTWGFDSVGLPLTDTSTDTAAPIETPTGGTGLSPSPAGALNANTSGYVDYVDQFGRSLGGGTATPPPRTVYIRRWSVEPLPLNPNNTIIIQVLVTTPIARGAADALGSTLRLRDEARVATVKTRKAE